MDTRKTGKPIMQRQHVEDMCAALMQHDRRLQRKAIDLYFSKDVVFQHPFMLRTQGREAMYNVYRNYQISCDTKIKIREFVANADTGALWVDQWVTIRFLPWTYFQRALFQTVVFFKFSEELSPLGIPYITHQIDNYTASGFVFSFGTVGRVLYDGVFRRFGAWVLPNFGWLANEVQERLEMCSRWLMDEVGTAGAPAAQTRAQAVRTGVKAN